MLVICRVDDITTRRARLATTPLSWVINERGGAVDFFKTGHPPGRGGAGRIIMGGVACSHKRWYRDVAFFEKCEAAHTSPPINPSKIATRTGTKTGYSNKAPGGVHGTKTSYRRDGSCDGGDHHSGHDMGGGSAEHVTDLPPATAAFVLRRLTSFLPATARTRAVVLAPPALAL